MNSFVKSLLNVIPHGPSTPSCSLNTQNVLILDTDGSRVREITTGSDNNDLLYNERNDQLLVRERDILRCITLDGHGIYRYDISWCS
jgi:hypothetical protein